jgi:hypothetical protein
VEDNAIVPSDMLPVKAEAKAVASYTYAKTIEEKVYDAKVYPLCTNKIEPLGKLRQRKFSIVCQGNGIMRLEQLMNPFEKIEKLHKLYMQGIISEEDYKKKKKELLDQI